MPRVVLRGACLQYTMAPRSGLDKTAFTAVLHGSMFSSPVRESASAHEERAAAQAAGLRLLYHDAAKRPQQNRTCCGFAWFNVLKPVRESASAHEVRAAAQAAGLRLLYHGAQSRVHGKSCARGFYFVWIFLKKGVDIGRISSYNNKALRRYAVNAMRNCVMVAPATLTRIVRVRILLPQPNGSICCRFLSGYSAVGSALRSGRRGLEFKSQYSDHSENRTRQPKTA